MYEGKQIVWKRAIQILSGKTTVRAHQCLTQKRLRIGKVGKYLTTASCSSTRNRFTLHQKSDVGLFNCYAPSPLLSCQQNLTMHAKLPQIEE